MFDKPEMPNVGTAPPPPPAFGERTQKRKGGTKPQQTTFLGADSVPDMTQLGNKTFLGQ